jgi:type IV secretion system protein TrbL
MPQDAGVLTAVLKAIEFTILGGWSRLHADAMWLMRQLVLIDLGLACAWWIFSRDTVVAEFLQRLMYYTFFLWMVTNSLWLFPIILNSCIAIGLTAGGSTMTVAEFTNPSEIARLGLVATEPIFNSVGVWGLVSLPWWAVGLNALAGVVILAAFFGIALEMAVFLVEWYVSAVLLSFMLVFSVSRQTAWIAEGTMGSVLAHGVKVMTLAFVTAAIFPTLYVLKVDQNPKFGQICGLVLGSVFLAALAWFAPRYAKGLLGTGPQLTAGVWLASGMGGLMAAGTLGNLAGGGVSKVSQAMRDAARMPRRRDP